MAAGALQHMAVFALIAMQVHAVLAVDAVAADIVVKPVDDAFCTQHMASPQICSVQYNPLTGRSGDVCVQNALLSD